MKIKNFKNATKKQKLIILGVVVSLGVIILGVGLGIGLQDTSIPITKKGKSIKVEGKYWETSNEADPLNSTKQLKTLRIKKELTTEAQLDEAYTDIISKKVDITYFNELLLPYHLEGITNIKATAKKKLHLTNVVNDQVGYIFNKSDYKADTIFKSRNIVELNLPETVTSLPEDQFRNNRIRKVNFEELTKLTKINHSVFYDNRLNGDLDLSPMKELTSIGGWVFAANNITGTLTLPPNVELISSWTFNTNTNQNPPRYNKISGTLRIPKSTTLIGEESFVANNIEVLDWSEADNLAVIHKGAFIDNKLKTLDFSLGVLPKINDIKDGVFKGNQGQNDNNEMFTKSFTLPPSLQTLGKEAIKVKAGITITFSKNSTGINEESFEGAPVLNKLTS